MSEGESVPSLDVCILWTHSFSESIAAKLYEQSYLKRFAVGEWPWRSLKVIEIAAVRYVIDHLLLVVSNNNDPHLALFLVYLFIWSRDCLWPWEVRLRKRNLQGHSWLLVTVPFR